MKRSRYWLGLLLSISALSLGGIQTTRASITPRGQQGCETGTVVGGPNLIVNGDFAQGSVGFTSQIPDRGRGSDGTGVYPDDYSGGGFSIQRGPKTYEGGVIIGRPFPGDPQRDVAASETYFYSNVRLDNLKDNGGKPLYGPGSPGQAMLWSQQVAVLPNTTYNFFGYFDNLLRPDVNGEMFADPKIELRVDGVTVSTPVAVQKTPDQWVPIQFAFTTGASQTSATLQIVDLANKNEGDDFGMTQINLKQCAAAIGAAKAVLPTIDNKNGTFTVRFVFTVKNLARNGVPMTDVQIVDDLAAAFTGAASFSVQALTASGLSVNPAFDGVGEKRLLTPGNTLAAGATATVNLAVLVRPGNGPGGKGPFYNSATVSASSGGVTVEDRTAPGFNPDPNEDGDPKQPGEDRPTPIYLAGQPLYLPLVRR